MRKNNKITAILVAVLIVTTFLCYLKVSTFDFTNWDDDVYIVENKLITQKLSPTAVWKTFTTVFGPTYMPLTYLSFLLEYNLFGMHSGWFHITNLLLHIAVTVLVFFLMLRFGLEPYPAFAAALLFGIHPLHVESVAWLSERKDVLSTLFFVGSLLLYFKYLARKKLVWLAASLIIFALGLLAKPMLVTLPLVLLAVDWLRKRNLLGSKVILEKIPYFILSIGIVITTILTQQASGAIKSTRLVFPDCLLIAMRAVVFYLYKTILPLRLSALYPYPDRVIFSDPRFWLPPVIIAILAATIVRFLRKQRVLIFGLIIFLITLFPVSGIIPIGQISAADRYMYIPSIGLFAAIVVLVRRYLSPKLSSNQLLSQIGAVLLIALLTLLGVLTFNRTLVWKNSSRLWSDALKKYPHSAIAHLNMGQAIMGAEKFEKAKKHFHKAIESEPEMARAWHNIGLILSIQQKYDQAVHYLKQAHRFDSDFIKTYKVLGHTYVMQGKFVDALKELAFYIEKKPDDFGARFDAAFAAARLNKTELVIQHLRKAIELNPNSVESYDLLGIAYCNNGDLTSAERAWKRALQLKPGNQLMRQKLKQLQQQMQ